MTGPALLAAVAAASAGALLLRPDGALPPTRRELRPTRRELRPTRRELRPPRRAGASVVWWRGPWLPGALAALAVALLLPGPVGWVAAVPVGLWARRSAARWGAGASRRATAATAAEVPVLVDLLAGALAAGAPVARALETACAAWPGAAADRLGLARSRLALGGDPVSVWEEVARDPAVAPLGRALARAGSSGAPVADVVARLSADLADRSRADAEDRARAVGVRAAVPLGLCLLPAFVLLGIVPLAAGLLDSLT